MKIIADCGATKSQWRVLYDDGSIKELTAGGINASTMSATAIAEIISEISDKISAADFPAAEIYLYMAGLASVEGILNIQIIPNVLATLRLNDRYIGIRHLVCDDGCLPQCTRIARNFDSMERHQR